MIDRLAARIARPTVALIDVQLFHVLYCALVLAQFVYNFADQYLFFRLQPPGYDPTAALGIVPMPHLDGTAFLVVGVLFGLCLLLATLGVGTRVALVCAAVLYFFYFSQIRNLSYILRKTNFIPITLVLLALTPGIQSSGIRSLVRSLRQVFSPSDAVAGHGLDPVPAWPLRLYRFLISILYFSAAYSKLRTSGLGWAGGGGLQTYMFQNYLWNDVPLTHWIAERPPLVTVLSLSGIVLEMSFWVAAVWPRTSISVFFALFGIAFHVGNEFMMTIQYTKYFLPSYAIFVNLALITAVQALVRRRSVGVNGAPAPRRGP